MEGYLLKSSGGKKTDKKGSARRSSFGARRHF